MPGKPSASDKSTRTVRSDLADPSRPGGRHGLRQPIEPAPLADPRTPPVSDHDLAARVRRALAADGRLADQTIDVTASGGVVCLAGQVAQEFQRSLAAALVQSVAGVLVVENHLFARETGVDIPSLR